MILPLGKLHAYVMEEVLGSIPSEALFTSYFEAVKLELSSCIYGRGLDRVAETKDCYFNKHDNRKPITVLVHCSISGLLTQY